ncbi:MAG: hypothetical protein M1389_00760 [Chloroflexi bacterium]|nr:hypothetical protein [Chloroflexota bacterium]
MSKSAARRMKYPASNGVRRTGLRSRWLPLLLLVPVALVLTIAVASVVVPSGQPSGTLTAEKSRYDYGNIPYSGGEETTRFALQVDGQVRITSLTTT